MPSPHPLVRTELLLGSAALTRLRDAHVTLAGLGAVGSFAAEALVRSGVGHLRIVDFDTVAPSNINRQLYALHSTIGQPKTEVAAARLRDINPDCELEVLPLYIERDTVPQLIAAPCDCLIDAIDMLSAKVDLLQGAVEAGIPVISSMGAATRSDLTQVHVDDLARTHFCPLARFVRRRLKKRGISGGIRCVYSREPAHTRAAAARAEALGLVPECAVEGTPQRVPLGTYVCITGYFGLLAANEAIRVLLSGVEEGAA